MADKPESMDESNNSKDLDAANSSGDDNDDRKTTEKRSSTVTSSSSANKCLPSYEPELPPMGDSLQIISGGSSFDSFGQNDSQRSSASQSKEKLSSATSESDKSQQNFQVGESPLVIEKPRAEINMLKPERGSSLLNAKDLRGEIDDTTSSLPFDEDLAEIYGAPEEHPHDSLSHPDNVTDIPKDISKTKREYSDRSLERDNLDSDYPSGDDYQTESDNSYDEKIYNFSDSELASLIKSHMQKETPPEEEYTIPHLLLQRKKLPHLISEDTIDDVTEDVCAIHETPLLQEDTPLPLKFCNSYSLKSKGAKDAVPLIPSLNSSPRNDTTESHHGPPESEEKAGKPAEEMTLKEHLSRISQEVKRAEEMGNVVIQKLKSNFQDITDGITTMTEDLAGSIADLVKEVKDSVLPFDQSLPRQAHAMFDQLWRSISQEVDQLKQLSDHITSMLGANFGDAAGEFEFRQT